MFATNLSFFAALLQCDTLKVLTLTQPWATLMAIGAKRIETRSWANGYQGPVAIHAAKGFPQWAEDTCGDEPFCSTLNEAGYPWRPGTKRNPRGLPLGQIVAVGWLDRVEHITQHYAVTTTERAFGNYDAGRSAWCFTQMYQLKTPIKARGSLGLWSWQPPESFWQEMQDAWDKERQVSLAGRSRPMGR